jgi:hypothetical protein
VDVREAAHTGDLMVAQRSQLFGDWTRINGRTRIRTAVREPWTA